MWKQILHLFFESLGRAVLRKLTDYSAEEWLVVKLLSVVLT